MPEGWKLQADVPDGIFTLAVEADDETAAAEHAAFAGKCLPLLLRAIPDSPGDPELHKSRLITQLSGLRHAVKATGTSYLGAIAGPHQDRTALVVLGIASTPMNFPAAVDPASLLAALARHRYPGAAVEEFETLSGTGVGIQRYESQPGPLGVNGENAGVAEALVPFPDAGLLGAVTGYSYTAADIDLAAAFAALIACRMRAVASAEKLRQSTKAGKLRDMAKKNRDLLRPEDATSLEEFQARKVVEQAQIRGMNSSWTTIGKILLSSVLTVVAIIGWVGFATAHDASKWVFLVIAIIVTLLVVRIFGAIELRAGGGSKRYIQLNRLDREWQAKAERGEIPRTTFGGPKVWKDQVEDHVDIKDH